MYPQPPVHSYSALESDGGPQDWNSVYLDPAGSEGRGLGFSGLADDNYAYDVHATGCMSYSQHDFPEGQQETDGSQQIHLSRTLQDGSSLCDATYNYSEAQDDDFRPFPDEDLFETLVSAPLAIPYGEHAPPCAMPVLQPVNVAYDRLEDTPFSGEQDSESFYNPAASHNLDVAHGLPAQSPQERDATYYVHEDLRHVDSLPAAPSEGSHAVNDQPAGREGPPRVRDLFPIHVQPPWFVPCFEDSWFIPQLVYAGKKARSDQTLLPSQFMDVNVAVSDAADPERLARALEDPLGPGFPEDSGTLGRIGQKFTVRYVCIDHRRQLAWQLTNPKQINEYVCTTRQPPDPFLQAARIVHGNSEAESREDPRSKPLVRIALVVFAVQELQEYMAKLEAEDVPLSFRDVKVDFYHLRIIALFRPQPAAVQPTLDILPEFRHIYSKTAYHS
ncbi:hypothetical protein VTO73DRAFT_12613 [Trametes versicolor]